MSSTWVLMEGISRDALPKLGSYCFIAFKSGKQVIVPNAIYKFGKNVPWDDKYEFVCMEPDSEEEWDDFFHSIDAKDVVAFYVVEKPRVSEDVIREWKSRETGKLGGKNICF